MLISLRNVSCLVLALAAVGLSVAPTSSHGLAVARSDISSAYKVAHLRIRQEDGDEDNSSSSDDDDDDDDNENGAAQTAGNIGFNEGEQAQQGDGPSSPCDGDYSLDGTCDDEGNTSTDGSDGDTSTGSDSSDSDGSDSSTSDDEGSSTDNSNSNTDDGDTTTNTDSDDSSATTTTSSSVSSSPTATVVTSTSTSTGKSSTDASSKMPLSWVHGAMGAVALVAGVIISV